MSYTCDLPTTSQMSSSFGLPQPRKRSSSDDLPNTNQMSSSDDLPKPSQKSHGDGVPETREISARMFTKDQPDESW